MSGLQGYSKAIDRALEGSEAAFQEQVLELARACGWLVHAERPALSRSGRWATPIQGDAGFPDLVLVHPQRRLLLFVELKMKGGKLTIAQQAWLDALNTVVFAGLAGVWRPGDWGLLKKTLKGEQ